MGNTQAGRPSRPWERPPCTPSRGLAPGPTLGECPIVNACHGIARIDLARGPCAQAEFQPALRDVVDRERLTSQEGRIAERYGTNRRSDTNTRGLRRETSQERPAFKPWRQWSPEIYEVIGAQTLSNPNASIIFQRSTICSHGTVGNVSTPNRSSVFIRVS